MLGHIAVCLFYKARMTVEHNSQALHSRMEMPCYEATTLYCLPVRLASCGIPPESLRHLHAEGLIVVRTADMARLAIAVSYGGQLRRTGFQV